MAKPHVLGTRKALERAIHVERLALAQLAGLHILALLPQRAAGFLRCQTRPRASALDPPSQGGGPPRHSSGRGRDGRDRAVCPWAEL
jgi:hypothetical protein